MAASSSPVDPTESIDTELGIQPFHAYSILDLKQIGTERCIHDLECIIDCDVVLLVLLY